MAPFAIQNMSPPHVCVDHVWGLHVKYAAGTSRTARINNTNHDTMAWSEVTSSAEDSISHDRHPEHSAPAGEDCFCSLAVHCCFLSEPKVWVDTDTKNCFVRGSMATCSSCSGLSTSHHKSSPRVSVNACTLQTSRLLQVLMPNVTLVTYNCDFFFLAQF